MSAIFECVISLIAGLVCGILLRSVILYFWKRRQTNKDQYLWWLKRKLAKRGIDIASTMTVKERDELVELGASLGSDEKIRKVLTIVPWATFCEWRVDYNKRKN